MHLRIYDGLRRVLQRPLTMRKIHTARKSAGSMGSFSKPRKGHAQDKGNNENMALRARVRAFERGVLP